MGNIYETQFEYIKEELELLDLRLEYLMELSKDGLLESLKLEIDAKELSIRNKLSNSYKNGFASKLQKIYKLYKLNIFERQCLIACLAAFIDGKYGRTYNNIQGSSNKAPSVYLLVELMCGNAESKLDACYIMERVSDFTKYVVKVKRNGASSLQSAEVLLNKSIVQYVLFDSSRENNDFGMPFRLYKPEEEIQELLFNYDTDTHISNLIKLKSSSVIFLSGIEGTGKKLLARTVAKQFERTLVYQDIEALLIRADIENDINMLICTAAINEAWICLDNYHILAEKENMAARRLLQEAITKFDGTIFMLSGKAGDKLLLDGKSVFNINVEAPNENTRRMLWEHYFKNNTIDAAFDWLSRVIQFKFTAKQIQEAIESAKNTSISKNTGIITIEDLYEACYSVTSNRLGSKIQVVKPSYSFDDLVLPENVIKRLHEVCNHIKYKYKVYEEWHFNKKVKYGTGVNVLFSGPPGTGKTMTAQVIAKALSMELYKVDISQVVSKYIGETEKQLNEIFDEAEKTNVVLFFDEADAVFGKRGEVKDAHDKYANLETSFLLQKMEEYEGLVILSTNYSQNIDEAFDRRMHFKIEFPFPDEICRERLWKLMIPDEAPTDELDYEFLAKTFELSGGNIKNVVLNAAFSAASMNDSINMINMLAAVKNEVEKIGKLFLKEKLNEYEDIYELL